jgi:hypothetical protein
MSWYGLKSLVEFHHSDEDAARQLFSTEGLLAHAPKGMMYHALGSEPARRAVDAEWQRLLKGAAARDRVERLVLTGMYLHFVVDRYVHPSDAVSRTFFFNSISPTGPLPTR